MSNVKTVLLASLVGVIMVGQALAADGKKKVYTDPEKVDEDFAFQGEYTAELERPGRDKVTFAAQVIALGGGKFKAAGYKGGLPGDGGKKREEEYAAGERKGDVVELQAPGEARVVIENKEMKVMGPDGKEIGRLKKVHRKSPTLGAKPPTGATVLFDGKSVDHWKSGAKMSDDGLLMEGCTSKKMVQSYKAHIEFRLPYMPEARGQGRGNSGFYIQGRYEMQMLDSFGLDGKDNECGGIYQIAEPNINMCYPPLSWQTYDVDFTAAEYKDDKKVKNARLTVKHNGVIIHDDLELPRGTPGGVGGEGPDPGPAFYLQDHNNPIRYRNIWVVDKD